MKPRHLLLIASIASFALCAISAAGAFASERYQTPPPLALSSQQAAPWISQLQSRPYAVERVIIAPRDNQQVKRRTPSRTSDQNQALSQTVIQAPVQATILAQQSKPKPKAKSKSKPAKTGLNPIYLPQDVDYNKAHKPGTIVIDTKNKFLYLVGENGTARRYGVGVGKQGFGWKGTQNVSRKAEWPTWHPPKAMIERERKKGKILPVRMEGGSANPLGARALYLGNTLYRIHGTNAPSTIGRAVSSGCIRMRNQDVEELYERVPIGTKVIVL